MFGNLRLWLDRLRSSLWLVPSTLVIGLSLLAQFLLWADGAYDTDWKLLAGAGQDGARGMLQAIAGSMITVAALVFSITLAVLAQSSAQYSPRVIRNFIRDRGNQAVLGVFLGIYAYCLLVLRGLGGSDERLPALAIAVGMVFAFLGIGVLIFFIHHIARAMQVSHILAAIEAETLPMIDRLYPEGAGEGGEPEDEQAGEPGDDAVAIGAPRSGYLLGADLDTLVDVARERDAVVHVRHAVGDFVAAGETVICVDDGGDLDDDARERLLGALSFDDERTLEQDVRYGIRQLVDVALKALSPGVNDTTNAVMVCDRLGVLLRNLASRRFPSPFRFVDDKLRLVAVRPGFEAVLNQSFDQIRQCAGGNPAVLARILEVLAEVHAVACSAQRRKQLRDYADRVATLVESSVGDAQDRAWVLGHQRGFR